MTDFLHGIDVVEIDAGPRPIRTAKSSVIGLIGIAGKGPVNTPVVISGSRTKGSTVFGDWALGFTIPEALDGIFDQAGATVVVVNVCDPAVHTTDVADELRTFSGVHKAVLSKPYVSAVVLDNEIVAPAKFIGDTLTLPVGILGVTSIKSPDGTVTYVSGAGNDYTVAANVVTRLAGGDILASADVLVTYTAATQAGTDYTLNADTGEITRALAGKIMPKATIKVDFTYVDPTKVTEADIIGGENAGLYEGVHVFLGAKSQVAVQPKVLIAPHFTHQRPAGAKNAVGAELEGIADRLRAVFLVDS